MLTPNTDKSRSLQARIVAGSVVLLSGSTLAAVLNFLYNIAIAHFLGPGGFAHATVVYTLLTLISAATLSFQIVTAKVVAQQQTLQGKSAVYRQLHRDSWGWALSIALLLILFQRQISDYLNLPSSLLVVLLAIGSAFYIPLGARRGYLQGAYGFRKFASSLVLEAIVRLGGSVLMVVLGTGVTGVIAANAAAEAVSWLAIVPHLSPKDAQPVHIRSVFPELAQAVAFFAGQVLINNYSIVQVKHYFLAQDAGIYAAVAMVGRVIFTLSSAVVNSMFPIVAGTSAEERKNHSVLKMSLLLVFGMGSLLALLLRVMPSGLWTIVFGAKFALHGQYSLSYLFSLFAITTVVYSLSVVMITYEMAYKIANTSWVQLLFAAAVIAAVARFHSSLREVILVQLALMVLLLAAVGVPFLRSKLRSAGSLGGADSHGIRLIRRVTGDEVIAEFLKNDFEHSAYSEYHGNMRSVVHSANLEDPSENAKRRALLFLRHLALWQEIPEDTEWYEAELRPSDLNMVQVFPRAQWRRIARGRFVITDVVERMRAGHKAPSDAFTEKIASMRSRFRENGAIPPSVVLIGLNEGGPLTIIDGNHRFVAAVMEGKLNKLRFLCGLSPNMTRCCWYRTNLLTLTRYARNLVRQLSHRPEVELARLFESPEAN